MRLHLYHIPVDYTQKIQAEIFQNVLEYWHVEMEFVRIVCASRNFFEKQQDEYAWTAYWYQKISQGEKFTAELDPDKYGKGNIEQAGLDLISCAFES